MRYSAIGTYGDDLDNATAKLHAVRTKPSAKRNSNHLNYSDEYHAQYKKRQLLIGDEFFFNRVKRQATSYDRSFHNRRNLDHLAFDRAGSNSSHDFNNIRHHTPTGSTLRG